MNREGVPLEVTINPLSDVEQEAEIQLSPDELQPHFERAYVKYQPKVEMRGFRKGRVPLAMIKKIYGEAIEQDSLDTIATESYQAAMEERSIRPIGQPALVDMDFKRGEHLRFRIKYQIKPTIELKQYKGIAVEKPVYKVTDEDVQAEIERLRRINSTLTEQPSVGEGEHVITGDVQELDETGSPLIGKKTPNAKFNLHDPTLAQEVKDALAHAETGGTYRAKFDSTHGDHVHKIHITISVKRIERVELPTFDDAFVRKVTQDKVSSSDEFLKAVRADLERYRADQSERKLADSIVSELVRMHEFPVPETIVESYLDAFVEDIKNRSKDRNLPRNFDEEAFRRESRGHAIWQAKWLLLRERVAEAEGIEVGDGEIEQLAAAEAASLGIDKKRLVDYYKTSHGVRDRLLTEKLMTFLKSHAIITEKTVERTPEE